MHAVGLRRVAAQHRDLIATTDYCDVTLPLEWQVRVIYETLDENQELD